MSLLLTDLVVSLRNSLLDSTGPYLWTDLALQQAVQEAVTEHSFLYPRLVYTLYDVAANQQDFTIVAVGSTGTIINPSPPPVGEADMLSVVGVELPAGTSIPEDPWRTLDPPPANSSRSVQGYRWRWGALRLRQPATGTQVGNSKLVVILAQTWLMPDTSIEWNGPKSDVPLLLLLAKRSAYQLLAEWQVREQGLSTPTIASGTSNVHIDIVPILSALEAQITRALALRAPRGGTFPVLPPSP